MSIFYFILSLVLLAPHLIPGSVVKKVYIGNKIVSNKIIILSDYFDSLSQRLSNNQIEIAIRLMRMSYAIVVFCVFIYIANHVTGFNEWRISLHGKGLEHVIESIIDFYKEEYRQDSRGGVTFLIVTFVWGPMFLIMLACINLSNKKRLFVASLIGVLGIIFSLLFMPTIIYLCYILFISYCLCSPVFVTDRILLKVYKALILSVIFFMERVSSLLLNLGVYFESSHYRALGIVGISIAIGINIGDLLE